MSGDARSAGRVVWICADAIQGMPWNATAISDASARRVCRSWAERDAGGGAWCGGLERRIGDWRLHGGWGLELLRFCALVDFLSSVCVLFFDRFLALSLRSRRVLPAPLAVLRRRLGSWLRGFRRSSPLRPLPLPPSALRPGRLVCRPSAQASVAFRSPCSRRRTSARAPTPRRAPRRTKVRMRMRGVRGGEGPTLLAPLAACPVRAPPPPPWSRFFRLVRRWGVTVAT